EPTGSIGTLGAFDPAGESVPSEAGNLTTPGPIDLQATLAALVARGARGAAMEVSSHSLDQGRVDGLLFRAALFTNLTRDHLDYHKTLDDYFRAKAKLVQYVAPDGLEVVNADDPAWLRLRREHRRVTFGERSRRCAPSPSSGSSSCSARAAIATAASEARWAPCACASRTSRSRRRTIRAPRTRRRFSTRWKEGWSGSRTTAKWTAGAPSPSPSSWRGRGTPFSSRGRGTRPTR